MDVLGDRTGIDGDQGLRTRHPIQVLYKKGMEDFLEKAMWPVSLRSLCSSVSQHEKAEIRRRFPAFSSRIKGPQFPREWISFLAFSVSVSL